MKYQKKSTIATAYRFKTHTDVLFNNEAMNDEASVESESEASFASVTWEASLNWENLFERLKRLKIDAQQHKSKAASCNWYFKTTPAPRLDVELTDNEADQYDFADDILMRGMQQRLVEALQVVAPTTRNGSLKFGNKFFMTMNDQHQRSFFLSIFNLPVSSFTFGEDEPDERAESPAITISTSALLETLPHLHWGSLAINNFALTRQSDVQELSNIILSKSRTLVSLHLDSIECPVDDHNREDSDEPSGVLDPLFYAASGLKAFFVSTKTRSAHSTLVSPKALRALIVEMRQSEVELCLRGLGLTDNHVLAIVHALSLPQCCTTLIYLNLESNPGITDQGYGALLNLVNRVDLVGHPSGFEWIACCVDDKAWEGELNLLTEMNCQYKRLQYMTNGTFTSDERRWQWLERVVKLPREYGERGEYLCYRGSDEYEKKKRDAKHLNFIWYTLRQNPEMMQVLEAPTRFTSTKKRKRTLRILEPPDRPSMSFV
jgi:hypothetical protein